MNWKLVVALMVSFALLMSSSYTMLIPFLPIYMQKELNADASLVSLWSGFTYAITFAVSAFVAPLWGKLSDKMGKKPMIIRSSILIAITYFLGGIVQTPFQLFLVRAFQGVAAGLWPACLVMISAYVPKNKLGFSMGLMQSANICGGILGPLFGGLLATSLGMRNSFFISSAVLLSICLITIFEIKEPPKAKENKENKKDDVSYMTMLKDRNIALLLMCVGLTNLVIMQIQPIVALYVQELSGPEDNAILLSGFILSLGGIAGAIASPFWGKAGQKIGFAKTITAAFIVAGALMMCQGLPKQLFWFGAMQFFCGLGFSGIFPSANSILVLLTPPSSRGVGFGLLFSAQMIGGAIGPILGGLIVTILAFNSVYIISGGILFVIGIYLLFFASNEFKEKSNASNHPENKVINKDYILKIKEEATKELATKKRN